MGSQFLIYEICVQNHWDTQFDILVGDSDTGGPSSITVRIECLFPFQFWYCEFCAKNQWGRGRKHYFFNYCFERVLDLSVSEGWWGSCNRIFWLSFPLNFWSDRRASHYSSYLVLVLIKVIRMGSESKISGCYPRGLRASPQAYYKRGGVI